MVNSLQRDLETITIQRFTDALGTDIWMEVGVIGHNEISETIGKLTSIF